MTKRENESKPLLYLFQNIMHYSNVPIGLLIGSNRLVVWVGGIILYVGIKVRFLVLVLNPQASRVQELWLGEGQVGRQGLGWVTGLEFS